ncbi:MAG: hypothetical protein KKD01_19210 [Proteobacteria bacterium]|nr:hypothetical protein [Pseudomonadota bacterium]MBU1420061.1 hypothetical protein [Pseudomonadota bacterium]MBU1456851.1 hypothetical protein [Pseudomonadota bacterium]
MNIMTNKGYVHLLTVIALIGCAMCTEAANKDYIVAPSGGDISGTKLSAQLANGDITLKSSQGGASGSGNVIINDIVSWSDNTTLTLEASNSVIIMANISAGGDNAGLMISPATANGNESANPTGAYSLNGSSITLSGNTPNLIIAGSSYAVINSLGTAADAKTPTTTSTLQGMAATANLAKNFVLGSDIDATETSTWNSGAGFTPIGDGGKTLDDPAHPFTGNFDGLGHTIRKLEISLPDKTWWVGLFGNTGQDSEIRNLGLIDADITGNHRVGGLVGENNGLITQSYAQSVVTGVNNVAVLVGYNTSSGAVKKSYSSGNVNITNKGLNGGSLVGANSGVISNSYSTGSVSGNGKEVGGLVGLNDHGTISNCYAAGSVAGSQNIGGLAGTNTGGTINNSYWNTETSGQTASAGGQGLTTAEMQIQSSFTGFDFPKIWTIIEGAIFPLLSSEYSTTIYNAHQLQLMATNLGANYTLGADIDASATSTGKDIWGDKGFIPIGTESIPFTGTLDGKEHTISNITINWQETDNVGLFSYTSVSSNIRDVGLNNSAVTGQNSVGVLAGYNGGNINSSFAEQINVTGMGDKNSGSGGLVGTNGGTINDSHTSGNVTGIDDVGGLVGVNGGEINAGYSLAAVTNATGQAGGLVGTNDKKGRISSSYAIGVVGDVGATGELGGLVGLNTGSIIFSNALGRVDCGNGSSGGGLAGNNSGSIANSYATGGVSGIGHHAGGLVGRNATGSTIEQSYATGTVAASENAGGLVGENQGTITNGYWNSSVNSTGVGQGPTTGATGLTAAQMLVSSNFNEFTITPTPGELGWVVINTDGSLQTSAFNTAAATSPMLATEYSTTINNAHQLQMMVMNLGASYSMDADVEAEGTGNGKEVWGILGFVPVRVGNTNTPFTGTFDGQRHKISKLRIDRTDNNVGLFGYIKDAEIKNVGLSQVQVGGANSVGGLAGYNVKGSISNCYVSGHIYGCYTFYNSEGDNIGVLVGQNNGGTINNCYATGIAYGGTSIGGLVGYSSGSINNSYAASNTNARKSNSAGLVGYNAGTITNSYARGPVIVKGNSAAGGLVSYGNGSITNSYWDTTTSGQSRSAGGRGLNDTQMQQQSSFYGWDFTNTWEMKIYPALRNMPVGYMP